MVVGVPLSGTGALVSWHTPTSREGAVWGIAGPVAGPSGDSTFIMGKRGVGYLLTTSSMGGIGGQLAARTICPAFGAGAVSGPTVYEPCYGGLAAISVSAAQRTISVRWRGPDDGNGSPGIGGGAVWVASTSSGILYELDPANGAVRSRIGIGLPHFPSVSLADGTAFIGTLDSMVAVNGA